MNFVVYESLKDWLVKSRPFSLIEGMELGVVTKFACGAIVGTIGQTIAYPLEVIRRRMKMVGWKDATPIITKNHRRKSSLQYSGMVDAFRKPVRNAYFGALYNTLVLNSVKVSI